MKKFFALITVILLILSISGCSDRSVDKPVKSSKQELRLSAQPSAQGYIYYSDGNSVRRVKSDGSGDEAFTDFYSTFLFVTDGWVYYTDNENHPEYPDYHLSAPVIHRRKEDGTADERISPVPASDISYNDGYIYYTPYYGPDGYTYGTGLRRIKPDGSDESTIYPDSINSYYFDGGYIYIGIAGGDIIRVTMDGSDATDIIDASEYSALGIFDVIFDDEYIYYNADLFGEYLDNRYLYRIKKDGSEKTQLTDMPTNDFIVSGKYIYFIGSKSTTSDRYLYKITVDGKNLTRIGKKVSYDNDYLRYDGTHIYVYFVDGMDYTESFGFHETSSLYKIKCDR